MEKEKKYLLVGIPILFIIGATFHYIYELTNENFLIGLISPVNESIWEHTKLSLVPMTIYWLIYPKINKNINKNKWYYSMIISILVYIITIPILYYFYTGAFGIESVTIDILILLISITFAHIIGYYTYTKKEDSPSILLSIFILIIIYIIYITFTINTPKLPIFYSKTTNSYGTKN